MNSINIPDDDEDEVPKVKFVVKELPRQRLTRAQIIKLLEEENVSEFEP